MLKASQALKVFSDLRELKEHKVLLDLLEHKDLLVPQLLVLLMTWVVGLTVKRLVLAAPQLNIPLAPLWLIFVHYTVTPLVEMIVSAVVNLCLMAKIVGIIIVVSLMTKNHVSQIQD